LESLSSIAEEWLGFTPFPEASRRLETRPQSYSKLDLASVLESHAEHHVAPAFAVDRMVFGKSAASAPA